MPKVSLQEQQQRGLSVSLSYLDCLDVSQRYTHSPELAYFVNWTETTYKNKTFQVTIFSLWHVSFIMKIQVRER